MEITKKLFELRDENMLHGLLLSEIKDYDECVKMVDEFLPSLLDNRNRKIIGLRYEIWRR